MIDISNIRRPRLTQGGARKGRRWKKRTCSSQQACLPQRQQQQHWARGTATEIATATAATTTTRTTTTRTTTITTPTPTPTTTTPTTPTTTTTRTRRTRTRTTRTRTTTTTKTNINPNNNKQHQTTTNNKKQQPTTTNHDPLPGDSLGSPSHRSRTSIPWLRGFCFTGGGSFPESPRSTWGSLGCPSRPPFFGFMCYVLGTKLGGVLLLRMCRKGMPFACGEHA